MLQIWTNPSVNRSFINMVIDKSELLEYLKLSSNNKEIFIFPNMEYDFSFYDSNSGILRSLRALVTNVYEDQIKVKHITNAGCTCSRCSQLCNKKKINEPPMPTCNCILNPPDVSKYNEPETYFISIHNLVSVSYINGPKDRKGDVNVMILGISASMVKAIVVRLEIFDDSKREAIKLVDLKAGNVYNITYEGRDGTIYETTGRVARIEEVVDGCCPPVKPGRGFVREYVASDNCIYHDARPHDKSDFMNEKPVKMVKIIMDSSEYYDDSVEFIMLHSIRDCTLVEGSSEDVEFPEVPDTDQTSNSCCGSCDSCSCGNNELKYSYNTNDQETNVSVNGENVSICVNGETTNVSLDSIIKFYIGIE